MAPIINGNNGNNGNNGSNDNGAPKKTSTGANGGTSKPSSNGNKSVRGGRSIGRRNSDLGTATNSGVKHRGVVDGLFATTDSMDKKPSAAEKLGKELDEVKGALKESPLEPIPDLDMDQVKSVHESSVKEKKKMYEQKEKEEEERKKKRVIAPDEKKAEEVKRATSERAIRLGEETPPIKDLGSLYAGGSSKDKSLARNKSILEGSSGQSKNDGITRKGSIGKGDRRSPMDDYAPMSSFTPAGALEKPRLVDYVNTSADNKFSKFRSGGSAGGYNIGNPQDEWQAKKDAQKKALPPEPVGIKAEKISTGPPVVQSASSEEIKGKLHPAPGNPKSLGKIAPKAVMMPERELESATPLDTPETHQKQRADESVVAPLYQPAEVVKKQQVHTAPPPPPPAVIVPKEKEEEKPKKEEKLKEDTTVRRSTSGYILYDFPLLELSSIEIVHKQNTHALCLFEIDPAFSNREELKKFMRRYSDSNNLKLSITSPDATFILFQGSFIKFSVSDIDFMDSTSKEARSIKVYAVSNSIKYARNNITLINVFLDATFPEMIQGLGLVDRNIKLNLPDQSQDKTVLTQKSTAEDNYGNILAVGCCYDEDIWGYLTRQGMYFSKAVIANYSNEASDIQFGIPESNNPIYLTSTSYIDGGKTCIERFIFSLSSNVMYGDNVRIRNVAESISFGDFIAFETKEILKVGDIVVIDRRTQDVNDFRSGNNHIVEGCVSYVHVYTEQGTNIVKCFCHMIVGNKGFESAVYEKGLNYNQLFPYESDNIIFFDTQINNKPLKKFHTVYFKGIIRYFDIDVSGKTRRRPIVLPLHNGLMSNNSKERNYLNFNLILPHTLDEDTSYTMFPPSNSNVLVNLSMDSTHGYIHTSLDAIKADNNSGSDITEYSILNKESSIVYDGSFTANKKSINAQGDAVLGAIFESTEGVVTMEADEIVLLSDTKVYMRSETDFSVTGDDIITINRGTYNINNKTITAPNPILDMDNGGIVTKNGISKE